MTEQDIPEIDIYDRQYHKSETWKKYFESDSIDAELDHPDFDNRERMRRKIIQKAMNRYVADLAELTSSDWVNDEMPCDNNQWFRLHTAYSIVFEHMFAHTSRLYEEE